MALPTILPVIIMDRTDTLIMLDRTGGTGTGDPAKFLQRPREGRRSVMGLEGSHQTAGLDQTQLQRTGQAQKIIPILGYEAHPHFVGGEIVEWAIIGFRIDPPEPATADVGNARAELVAEQPKNAEDHVGVCAGIGHDFGRLKLCLLFEHDAQQHEAIAQKCLGR
jgi:hypothetical protein